MVDDWGRDGLARVIRLRIGLALLIVVVAAPASAGCSSGNEGSSTEASQHDNASTSTTEVFNGDPASEFCGLIRRVFEVGDSGELSGAKLQEQFDFLAASEVDLLAAAPDELRDDVAEFIHGVGELGEALSQVGYDRSRLDSDSVQPTSAYMEAGSRVSGYHDQVCADSAAVTTSPDTVATANG